MAFSFRRNLLLLVPTIIIVLNLSVYFGAKLFLTDSYVQLERDALEANVQRAVNAFENDLEGLGTICTDWAVWDDTYDFIVSVNTDYIESNLVDSTFTELHLHSILLFNAEGRVVFSKAMDLTEGKEVEVPEGLLDTITSRQSLWGGNPDTDTLDGILLLPDGPMLVSGRHILTSEGEGPARGLLVMTRWIDKEVVTKLSERTALSLQIQNFVEEQKVGQLALAGETTIRVLEGEPGVIWGHSLLKDVDGQPALTLSLKMNRDIFNQGMNTLSYFQISFFLVSIVSGIALYLLILRNKEVHDESERRFRYVFENTTDGLLVVEPNGYIRMMNPACRKLLSVQGSSSSLESITDVFEGSALCDLIRDVLDGQLKEPLDIILHDTNRESRKYVHTHAAPLFGSKGTLIGAIVAMYDVTKQKEADLLKSEFIATAAHELSTPVASIMGFSELLLNQNCFDEDQQKEFLSIILGKSEALGKIVDDLLYLGNIESGGNIFLEKQSYDLNSSLNQVLDSCRNMSQQHQFENRLPGDNLEIVADRHRIDQVFDNLLSNAIKYSPEGGKVQVSGNWNGNELEVCVEDQGIGMQQKQLERAFEKFYRANSGIKAIEGLGLGLCITKNIIEEHGGRIWVESEPGQGTRVFFTLPR